VPGLTTASRRHVGAAHTRFACDCRLALPGSKRPQTPATPDSSLCRRGFFNLVVPPFRCDPSCAWCWAPNMPFGRLRIRFGRSSAGSFALPYAGLLSSWFAARIAWPREAFPHSLGPWGLERFHAGLPVLRLTPPTPVLAVLCSGLSLGPPRVPPANLPAPPRL